MRISRDRAEWNNKEIIRNVVGSIIVLLIVFLWDNRDYLFQYKLHQSEYIQVEGRIEELRSRKAGVRIIVQLPNGGERSVVLSPAWNEFIPLKDTIPMVFSPFRQPQLCRGNLVVTLHWLIALMMVISWNKCQVSI